MRLAPGPLFRPTVTAYGALALTEFDLLTSDEQLALAGLLRLLVRLDGEFSEDEEVAITAAASRIGTARATDDGAYRDESPTEALGADAFWKLIDRAAIELPDDEAIRRAAIGVERPAAREAIHAVLYDVASADAVAPAELSLLDWLANEWKL